MYGGSEVYDDDYYRRDREEGLTELVLKFIFEKVRDGFHNPWRGCAYLALLYLFWTLWPTVDYRARMFPEKDIRTSADRIDAKTMYAEVNEIRKRIVALAAEDGYGIQEAFADRKRLIWLDRRVMDEQQRRAVVNTIRLQNQTLEQHVNRLGQPDGEALLNGLRSLMNSREFRDIARWEPMVFQFAGFQVLLGVLVEYWWAWKYQILLVGMLYNLLTIKDRKLRLVGQVTIGFPIFFLASAFPQIGIWVYPTRDRAKEAVYMLRCAVYVLAFGLAALCSGTAKAQTGGQGVKKEARRELGIIPISGPSIASTPPRAEPQRSTLAVQMFGDVTGKESHDRQVILQYTAGNGFTVIQQNRQASDRVSAGGNVAAGWKFRLHRKFDLTAAAGPAFNYDVRGQKSGFNHQIIVFLISNWRTRFFQFSSLVKLMAPTDPKIAFGDRHIQTIRGPTERTPRVLQGIALQMENWHVNNPGGGHWVENIIGPSLNLGELAGRPKSFLSWFSVYPYRDFCRPQPGHGRVWDLRIQFKRTFALAN